MPRQAHYLMVILHDTKETAAAEERIAARLNTFPQSLEILRWETQAKVYWQSRAFLKKVFYIVEFIIALIFFFSIVNTVNMSLFERIREYGTMMAIGNSRRIVF